MPLGHRAGLSVAGLALAAAGALAQPPADDPVIARVLDSEIRASQRQQLGNLVLARLLEEYRRQRGIEASREEIDLFVAASAERQAKNRQERRARSEELERRLASEELDPEERRRLAEELATLRKLLTPNPAMERWRRENPARSRAIEEEVAARTIVAWKTNKALFDEHGGRVIFQQAGPEPIDAYRQHLEQQAAKGVFELLDPDAEADLWRYFVDDRMHIFLDGDGAGIFATPWWLLDRPLGEP